jgi:excisionase family DNA binding protein
MSIDTTTASATRSDAASSTLPRALFTAEEVAESLAVSESLVRQLTLTGDIPCRRIGRLVRYTPSDIDAFVAQYDTRGY